MNLVHHIRRFLAPAGLTCLLVVAAGCGGSGATTPSLTAAQLKSEVAESIQQGFSARSSVARSSGPRAAVRSSEGIQFDEFFGLWARSVEDGIEYFVDEAATQPGGRLTTTSSAGEDGSFTQQSNLSITEGRLKGYTYTSNLKVAEGRVEIELQGSDPLSGSFQTVGSFEGGNGAFSSNYTDESGLKRVYSVQFSEDGTSRVSFNTGSDFVYTLNFLADGSGTGSVTGADALLPAQIAWNSVGDGLMTFTDGSTLEIKGFDFVQF
ncbi:MAG: hypothetical protein MH204_09250 [Fimbriimonadaceae bacterium]|nr:hypothetical protein [Fimbriimonadaceae bacterium]